MRKLLFGAMLLALAVSIPVPTIAGVGVSVHIGIPLPPPIILPAPPGVILLPNTGVYVDPDLAFDLFFFDGWWWRPWEGRWYHSRDYRSGWRYYEGVPSFYGRVPPRWREDYREHRWEGREWNHQRVSHPQLQQMYRRNAREASHGQMRSQTQVREQPRMAGPQQARPQQQRPGPQHSQPPRGGGHGGGEHGGGGHEGRR